MDKKETPQTDENPLLRPDRELPAPHDMQLEAGFDSEIAAHATKAQSKNKLLNLLLLFFIGLVLVAITIVIYFYYLQ